MEQAEIDWSRTKAYSVGNLGNINLNIKGRDPEGVIEPDQVEAFIDELTAALYTLKDPDTGERMIAQVLRREEVYTGPLIDRAPDLLIRWVDDKYLAVKDYDANPTGPIFGTKQKFGRHGAAYALDQTGTHIIEGMVMLYGKGVRPGVQLHGAELLDLAPTVLHLLDTPIPKAMDGKPLLDAFVPEIAEKPVIYEEEDGDNFDGAGNTLSEEEERAIRERLQGLGYVS
jgi:predicted AlkP superfamily phosphohydrolase/phosphomutase